MSGEGRDYILHRPEQTCIARWKQSVYFSSDHARKGSGDTLHHAVSLNDITNPRTQSFGGSQCTH